MTPSRLVFRTSRGYSIYTCACGCDVSVKIPHDQLDDCPGPPRFYVRHHAPLGCGAERKGDPWTGDYSDEPISAPIASQGHTDEWDEVTPVLDHWPWDLETADERDYPDRGRDDMGLYPAEIKWPEPEE